MTRLRQIALAFAFLLFAGHGPATAQTAPTPNPEPSPPPGTPARTTPRPGGATGIDLGIEGRRSAPRGGVFRWHVTAYHVMGLSDLGPARDVELRATTSIAPDRAAIETTTDALGRALLVLPVPSDAPPRFQVVLEAQARGLRRRFDIVVSTYESQRIELYVDRAAVTPGTPVRVWGRVVSQLDGRAVGGVTVELLPWQEARGREEHDFRMGIIPPFPVWRERALGAPLRITTTARGGFSATLRPPQTHRGEMSVRARIVSPAPPEGVPAASSSVSTSIVEPAPPSLVVSAAARAPIARSGAEMVIDVVVRTAGGRPVQGATVEAPDRPSLSRPGRIEPPFVTDARGRTELRWAPSITQDRAFEERAFGISATHPSLGGGETSVVVRLVNRQAFAGLVPEGGAVSEELGGRVLVRVVGPDGVSLAGREVVMRGARLVADARGTTDSDGVAVVEVALRAADATRPDACGGTAATEVTLDVGGETSETCLLVDQDGAVRVRAAETSLRTGGNVTVELTRARVAAGLPIAVALVHEPANQPPEVVAETIVAPSETRAVLAVPPRVVGRVRVRARPLFGAARLPVRGGQTVVWVSEVGRLDASVTLDAAQRSASARFAGDAAGDLEGVVVTLPLADAVALHDSLPVSWPQTGWTDARLAAELARGLGPDTTAAAQLRSTGGRVSAVPLAAPRGAEGLGLLRDPWRARARFVEGRLGLILRAIESFVAEAVPMRMDDVAVRSATGWAFNREILEAIATGGGLGTEGARGLGGEPLTIDTLVGLDRAIAYDNVARRLTRERLFYLILSLRQLAQSRGLDLPGAGRGDPQRWLENLVGQYTAGMPRSIDRRDLVDGWGRAFVLRRVTAARYRAIQPIPGYELVSTGPDMRLGTGDDLFDPTARVLASGGAYARAVGEDELVARLRGVAMSRATLESAAWMFQASAPSAPSFGGATASASRSWAELPNERHNVRDPSPLLPRRAWIPARGHGGAILPLGVSSAVELELDEEPRAYGTVVHAWATTGVGASAIAAGAGGGATVVDVELPRFARVGETLRVPLWVTNLAATPAVVAVGAESSAGLRVEAPDRIELGAERAARVVVAVTALTSGDVTGALTLSREGRVVFRRALALNADEGLRPTRQVASLLIAAGAEGSVRAEIPDDTRRAEGRLVLLAPAALANDALLARAQRDDPALVAWSMVLGGRALPDALRGRLMAAQDDEGLVQGDLPVLSTAAAVVVWGAADADDADAAGAREAAVRALTSGAGQGAPRWTDVDAEAAAFRGAAATLAVLALSGLPADEEQMSEAGASDPVATHAETLRALMRRALRRYRTEPALAARGAAALLLADPEDGRGLALLDIAAAAVRDDADGYAFVAMPQARRQAGERLAATAALAVAAHQAGRTELRARLARSVIAKQTAAWRAGGEPAFWTLAAASYGALGASRDGATVRVRIAGDEREVRLRGGHAVVPLPAARSSAGRTLRVEVQSRSGAIAPRVEVATARPWQTRRGPALRVSLAGDPGDVGATAAFELTVAAHAGRDVQTPVIEVQLPAGTRVDDDLRAALGQAAGVVSVREASPNFLRLELEPMRGGRDISIPLPLRWLASGTLRGLGVVAYPSTEPRAMTVLAPRAITVEEARDP